MFEEMLVRMTVWSSKKVSLSRKAPKGQGNRSRRQKLCLRRSFATGWNPGFTPGDGSGTNEAPLPNDFFANLPPGFTTPASLDDASRREVVAEGNAGL
ncbi:hypothetical protein F2Q68_00039535 [Brassica cretica]|uniref:Uncharacterized protein n=1 Tax=Brassica cretica TaxID=69181 RepID=A0A8S9MUJ2_BRACR|nr:hypothetical protein F2Q68_00039535 [Brassica cretica]